jgi:MATE family multidrug resistance protein
VDVGAITVLAVGEAAIVSSALYCCRHVLGYAYSNEKDFVDYVAKMVPLLCLSVRLDSLLGSSTFRLVSNVAVNFEICSY